MFEKDLSITLLYDLYSPLLSEKKREVFEAYYLSDLSLAEISEDTGTSRQAVRDLIGRTKKELVDLEEKIGLNRKRKELRVLCDRALASSGEEMKKLLEQICEVI